MADQYYCDNRLTKFFSSTAYSPAILLNKEYIKSDYQERIVEWSLPDYQDDSRFTYQASVYKMNQVDNSTAMSTFEEPKEPAIPAFHWANQSPAPRLIEEDDTSLDGKTAHPSYDPLNQNNSNFKHARSISARAINQLLLHTTQHAAAILNLNPNQVSQTVESQEEEIKFLVHLVRILTTENSLLVNTVNRLENMLRSGNQ